MYAPTLTRRASDPIPVQPSCLGNKMSAQKWCRRLSPKSFHRNMEGTKSGFCLRFSILSCKSSSSSCGFTGSELPFGSAVSPSGSGPATAWTRGLRDSRFTQRMKAYRRGMPMGYTCDVTAGRLDGGVSQTPGAAGQGRGRQRQRRQQHGQHAAWGRGACRPAYLPAK